MVRISACGLSPTPPCSPSFTLQAKSSRIHFPLAQSSHSTASMATTKSRKTAVVSFHAMSKSQCWLARSEDHACRWTQSR